MKRRTFMKSVVAGSAAGGTLAARGISKVSDGRPNFLFMIANDLTYRAIRAMDSEEVHTPNLDRLVKNGCAFTHCFQQGRWRGAVCVASRMMLLTGLTTFRAEPSGPARGVISCPCGVCGDVSSRKD